MMKLLKYSWLLTLVFSLQTSYTKAQILSERAEISLLTSNPGTEIYIYFGHSAIRVKDPLKGIDWVYNYGTFDFNTPNFYTKFARGYLKYKLSVYPMHYFVQENRQENRSIYEQVLNLTQEEKELVFRFLEFNRQPGNEYYMYDFFFDNCATRILKVFRDELGDDLTLDQSAYESITFREMLAPYLEPHAWSRFGINLVLGAIADREATLAESTFLPDYLKTAFANAKLNNKEFAQPARILFQQEDVELYTPIFIRPGFVFTVLLLIILFFTYREFKIKKTYKLIDFLFFLFIGIIGLILFLLWTATSHTAVVKNWNLLWALPTHFLIAFFIFRKAKSVFLKYYFLVSGILAVSALVFWFLIPQKYDLAFIPLILIVSLRSYRLFQYYR